MAPNGRRDHSVANYRAEPKNLYLTKQILASREARIMMILIAAQKTKY
jgi:hypothetical protein